MQHWIMWQWLKFNAASAIHKDIPTILALGISVVCLVFPELMSEIPGSMTIKIKLNIGFTSLALWFNCYVYNGQPPPTKIYSTSVNIFTLVEKNLDV